MPRKSADIDIPRLCRAVQADRRRLEWARVNRMEMVRQYAGDRWGEQCADKRIPINLLDLYVSIVGRNLIAKAPRVLLSTFDRESQPVVKAMESWANREIEHMQLADTLQRVVVDALFSLGVCKVGIATPADAASVSWSLEAGKPFCELIDLDDWVHDTHANHFAQCSYMGHRYRVPKEAAVAWLGKKAKDLNVSEDQPYNEGGDERIKLLGRGVEQYTEEFEDMVDLWEIYLPRHRLVVTIADDYMSGGATEDKEGQALLIQNWIGPYCGPYHPLGFGVVPGNAMPKAPLQSLFNLHEDANNAARKVERMVHRMKEVLVTDSNATESGQRIMDASDGQVIAVSRPEGIKPMIPSGNALQPMIAAMTMFKDLFNVFGGNLEMMGGLSAQSKTATQDKMLNENSSRVISDMQERTVQHTSKVLESLCWYWHHDPNNVQRSEYKTKGASEVQEVFPARHPDPAALRRTGRFEDMGIRVDPYSLKHQTPESRLQFINAVVDKLTPLMPILMQQGIMFDANHWLSLIAKYGDSPDVQELFTIREPVQAAGGGSSEPPGMEQETTRNYVRENVSERTQKGHDQDMVARMLGHDLGGDSRNGQKTGAA